MNNELLSFIEGLENRFLRIESHPKMRVLSQDFNSLEQMVTRADFWETEENPSLVQQKFNELKNQKNKLDNFRKDLNYLADVTKIIGEESAETEEIRQKAKMLESELEQLEIHFFLSGKYDFCWAIFNIQAGAGGKDAEDWAGMLLRMYQRYFERKGWPFIVLNQQFSEGTGAEGRLGIKETSLEVKKDFSFGFLKGENGIHRLVRVSPFSAKQLRHTSFVKIEVLPKLDEIKAKEVEMKTDDLKIDVFRSSGPGGQNANRRETAVRVIHLPTGLGAISQVERTQAANKKIALQILAARVFQLQEEARAREVSQIKGRRMPASFGSQARSYILYPYKLVKDHRTGYQTSDVTEVLDGDLDNFIQAEIGL
ncbi:MAG: PCRF domain-containing protein [Candidatus Pacebacteria bacterium]|nr:PCRF domain-containing protein [Candidatus Paceibacterota bacterium]